jgi:2-oxoglutarate ferredoxin oxidoreductase subunit beta
MEPAAAADWLEKEMIPVFPLGEIKNTLSGEGRQSGKPADVQG